MRRFAACVLLVCACACARASDRAAPPALPAVASAQPAASAPPSVASAATAKSSEPAPAPRVLAPGSRAVGGEHGVVVSVEAQATRAGVSVLERGGNAVDAALAVAFALAVTHPSAGNLGGGGFMLARPPGGPTVAIDFRETAPAGLTRKKFDAMIAAGARGAVAAGVPGTVAGLLLAHERFGKLPRAAVLAPAIELAEKGHTMGARQALVLSYSHSLLANDPEARRVFFENGKPKRAGASIVQPELARTLRRIAERGRAGFYEGPTAQALLALSRRGGLFSEADLAGYRAIVRQPLSVRYHGVVVETMPPPSAGGVVLAGALGALERLRVWEKPTSGAEAVHALLEVSRRAQAVRRFEVLDPDSLPEAEREARQQRWFDPERLLAVPIEPRATPSERIHPLFPQARKELEHTTHFSVADRDGFVVSCTVTLSASFGSTVMVPGMGFFLGNAVASFGSIGDNQPVAGQRTTSSMAPTLLLDGTTPIAVLGTPGGDTIPSTLLQLVRHLIDDGMPLDAAVDAPRFHHGFVPDEARYETKTPPPISLVHDLEHRGHRLRAQAKSIGDAKCLVLDGSRAFAYSDPREGGLALAAEPKAP